MRDVTELPADLLDGRLAASSEPEDASSATRIAHVAQLAGRGEHPAAAREAAGLIEAGNHDARLIGFYLFGVFLQRGFSCLPALLGRVAALVADDLGALRPGRRKLQVVNSATAWLFEHVSAQLVFHAKSRGATWEAWCGEADSALPDAIAAGCTKLTLALEVALEATVDAPLAAAPLARVRRWALEDLRRALARREPTAERAPAAASSVATVASSTVARVSGGATVAGPERTLLDEPPGDPAGLPEDHAAPSDEQVHDSPDEAPDQMLDDAPGETLDEAPDEMLEDALDLGPDPTAVATALRARAGTAPSRAGAAGAPSRAKVGGAPSRASAAGNSVAVGSPALAVLKAKLAGFQDLVARGELARAAVVASDVRAVLASFDPVAYFPSMFAAYFKALHQVIDDLAPYLDAVDQPSWHALDSYYRADMRAFFED